MSDAGEATVRLVISNEFATVEVTKVTTGNGERLEISSLGPAGRSIQLDALLLESLTWRTVLEVGEEGLRTPFGPTDGDEPAPLLRRPGAPPLGGDGQQ
ncbi:MAG: dihydrodiol dehydrogenase [Acidimicrobiales bacterium]